IIIMNIAAKINEVINIINSFLKTLLYIIFKPRTFIKLLKNNENSFLPAKVFFPIISVLTINNLKYFLIIFLITFSAESCEISEEYKINPTKIPAEEIQ